MLDSKSQAVSSKQKEFVKTVSGRTIARDKAKHIRDNYHEENYDCFKVEGKWYRLDSGLISYNIDTRSFFLNKALDSHNFRTKVVIGFDYANNPIIGYTKLRKDFFIPVYSSKEVCYALNNDIAAKLGTFDPSSASFLQRSGLPSSYGGDRYNILNPKNFPYSLRDYKMRELPIEKYLKSDQLDYVAFHALLAKAYHDKNQEPIESKLGQQFNSILGNISFGVESESNNLGITDLQAVSRSGLVCLRDGSVDGFELVTLPHIGYEGILSTLAQFSVADKLFTYDHKCSVHIHVAGYELTDQQLLALYCLCYRIQDEIFEFVHPYKRNIEYLKQLSHEYSEPLKSLGIVYNKGIITKDGQVNDQVFNACFTTFCKFISMGNADHLTDCFGNEPKYRINSRYSWVNFVNFLKSRTSTLEFRCFPPSFDPYMISYWALLCQAIYRYGVRNWKKILSDNFHVKMDNIWDDLLSDVDKEDYPEFAGLVDNMKRTFSNIVAMNSSHAIARQVTYNHYMKMIKEYSRIYANMNSSFKKDLIKWKWEEPDIVKEISEIKVR